MESHIRAAGGPSLNSDLPYPTTRDPPKGRRSEDLSGGSKSSARIARLARIPSRLARDRQASAAPAAGTAAFARPATRQVVSRQREINGRHSPPAENCG